MRKIVRKEKGGKRREKKNIKVERRGGEQGRKERKE